MRLSSDRWSAAFWAAFGGVVVIASWRLDRLENLHINPWSVPGLTPGVVGLLMILLAVALAIQSDRAQPDAGRGDPAVTQAPAVLDGVSPAGPALVAETSPQAQTAAEEGDLSRTLVATVLCVLFAGVSLGHGLPFMVEGAAFILLFVAVFSWSQWRAEHRVVRGLLVTLAIAVASSGLISWLFESVFLVRLP